MHVLHYTHTGVDKAIDIQCEMLEGLLTFEELGNCLQMWKVSFCVG